MPSLFIPRENHSVGKTWLSPDSIIEPDILSIIIRLLSWFCGACGAGIDTGMATILQSNLEEMVEIPEVGIEKRLLNLIHWLVQIFGKVLDQSGQTVWEDLTDTAPGMSPSGFG